MSNDDAKMGCLGLIAIVIIGLCIFWFNWHKAGIQVKVYEREGIHMTQWEVLWGAKPAERAIVNK